MNNVVQPLPAPDIVRCAYLELVVTDLAASRAFYVDVLGLHVTEEDEEAIYLRSFEEFIHHNLVLRKGPVAAAAAFAYRVRTPEDVDRAEAWYAARGCRTERRRDGFVKGIGDSVRVQDPLGFPYEFFYETEHVERLTQRYDLYNAGELVRLDHFNQVTPDVPKGRAYLEELGFKVSEDIKDSDGVTYAAWMYRKQTVHDTALTGAMAHECITSPSPPTRSTTLFRSATRWVHCASRTGSNVVPAGTECPMPSTSTSWTPMGTGWRSIPRTTTPGTRTIQLSPGMYTIISAATGGGIQSCPVGTPRPHRFWTSTETHNPW